MPQKHKILIIGSSGMLGTDLSQELCHDYDLFGADIVRRSTYLIRGFYKMDVTKKESVSVIIKNLNPDLVIHTAAWTDVDGCERDPKRAYRINSEGTKNVALACKAAGAALVYISTDFVFDGKNKRPYKESARTKPLGAYAGSKLKGEAAVKKILKRYFIIRTGWLYGKNGKNFVDTILSKARKEKVLKVVNDQAGSPTCTKDLARAIHVLLNKIFAQRKNAQRSMRNRGYGIYHISNSESVSWFDYAKEILKINGSRTDVLPISSKELARPAKRPAMSVLDNSKYIKFTGFKMRNWQEALKDYAKQTKG